MAIDSRYKLKTGEEVDYFPPIQNTDNPYLTEAAMHADQANQLEGYGYLVDGFGAFTYLGTFAGTADYLPFGNGGTGLDLRASNLAGDLSTAEKDAILLKINAQKKDSQTPISTSQNVQAAWDGQTILFTASCTITVPSSLVAEFGFNFITMVGVTVTWAITTPHIWVFGTPTTTPEKTYGNFTKQGTTNNIILAI